MSDKTDDRFNAEAVDWLLRLENATDKQAIQQAFEQWLASGVQQQAAWQRVNGLLSAPLADLQGIEQLQPGHTRMASRALIAGPQLSRRSMMGKGLALVLLGAGGLALANRAAPLGDLLADRRTSTGERRRFTLADGSQLSLNARSAVDLRFDGQQRVVVLRAGELQVDVAADVNRPFIVMTREGQVRALGTRFTVIQEAGSSLVVVQQHSVLMTPEMGAALRVESGQALRFDRQGGTFVEPSLRTCVDWLEGRIEMRDEPLGDLIAALRPYRTGLLRVSPEAARIRVYGTFPLDDVDRTLRSLAETLPIRVETMGFWLTRIDVQ
ncbi:FecR domain-containing protein [Pseudomonas sp. LRF_L74]|uniref:FecR domain-containing protein n=1 Tax=Pseudomonas sp. LRF_L74 TaxID=3369422 RepID=UPI003F608F48